MALAILQFQDSDLDKCRFLVMLGVNQYYQYCIGGEHVQEVSGLSLIDSPTHISPLIGPIAANPSGQASLEVLNSQFSTQNRAIQIMSFRDQKLNGPAISEIIIVPILGLSKPNVTQEKNPTDAISLGMELSMKPLPIETVAFRYREVAPVSSAMAAGGVFDKIKAIAQKAVEIHGKPIAETVKSAVSNVLTGSVGALLPQLAGIIGAILPKLSQENIINSKTGKPIDREQMVSLLTSLLQQIGSTPPATQPAKVSSSLAYEPLRDAAMRQLSSPTTPLASRFVASPTLMGRKSGTTLAEMSPYGATKNEKEASNYGADLTAVSEVLALLLPALLKVTPDLIKMLGTGLMPTYSTLLKPQTRMAGQMSISMGLGEHQENEAVMMALGLAVAASTTAELAHDRVDGVELGFGEITPLRLQGRERLVYHRNQEIAFPLTFKTPKPIQKGRLQLLVKHPKTLEILVEENYRVEDVSSGLLAVVPKLSQEKLQHLGANAQKYLVCVTLVWKGGRDSQRVRRLGTSAMQLVTLMGDFWFDRLETANESIPLNDTERFRSYWHKIWEGKFENLARHIALDCKYYYALELDRSSLARMETLLLFDKDEGDKISGRLKSGLIADLHSLNDLIPQISAHPSLSQSELEALMTTEFKKQFSNLARKQVEFEGHQGDKVALWVYPEMMLQKVILKEVSKVNSNGLVQEVMEHVVFFPMPAIVHFVGVAT